MLYPIKIKFVFTENKKKTRAYNFKSSLGFKVRSALGVVVGDYIIYSG